MQYLSRYLFFVRKSVHIHTYIRTAYVVEDQSYVAVCWSSSLNRSLSSLTIVVNLMLSWMLQLCQTVEESPKISFHFPRNFQLIPLNADTFISAASPWLKPFCRLLTKQPTDAQIQFDLSRISPYCLVSSIYQLTCEGLGCRNSMERRPSYGVCDGPKYHNSLEQCPSKELIRI
jgi:hypothetical protein